MNLKKILSKIKLSFEDPAEEKEYIQIKIPLLKDFFTYLLVCMMFLLIPLSIHFFVFLELYPQGGMSVAMLVIAALLFLARNKFGNWMEYVVVGYLLAIVITVIVNLGQVLLSLKSCESFYGGYAFALLHRILGYRVIKFHSMLFFHIVSLILRLIILYDHNLPVSLMVTAVEISTMCLSIKSEKGERELFDSLYKSKHQLVKFKDFLVEHLPHQFVIFASDYSSTCLMNRSFKDCFGCNDIFNTKCALKALIIEKEDINKNMSVFARLGYIPDSKGQQLSLSQFMWLLSKNLDVIRRAGTISFQVYEDENIIMNPCTIDHQSDGSSEEENGNIIDITSGRKEDNKPRKKKQRGYLVKESDSFDKNEPVTPEWKRGPYSDRPAFVKETGGENSGYKEEAKSEPDRGAEDGKVRIFKVKIFLIQWDGEETVGVMMDDITQQKTIMELKMANNNKDMVITMVSNELRTPLNGMIGLIDIAKKKVNDVSALHYLNACRNSGAFILNLVNSILDMSQLKAQKLKLTYSKVSVREMLGEVRALFEPFYAAKKLYLKIEVNPSVPEILVTDRNRLNQILVNIVGNAFKFTYKGGILIKVQLEKKSPGKVKFTIQDTGVGIKEGDLKRLTKVFERMEFQTQNANGVGVGLTISNTLAMLMNPSDNKGIAIESEVGKGSSFSFVVQSNSVDSLEDKQTLSHDHTLNDIGVIMNGVGEEGDLSLANKAAPYVKENKQPFLKGKTCDPDTREKNGNNDQKHNSYIIKLSGSKTVGQNAESPWGLIVDDNPFNLMVGRHLMEEHGYRVKTAFNGREALERVAEHEKAGQVFKVMLIDCEMPVLDGFEVSKALRKKMKMKEIKECPIVALTANRDEENEKRCRDTGMIGSISKPLQGNELEEIISRL